MHRDLDPVAVGVLGESAAGDVAKIDRCPRHATPARNDVRAGLVAQMETPRLARLAGSNLVRAQRFHGGIHTTRPNARVIHPGVTTSGGVIGSACSLRCYPEVSAAA